MRFWDECGDFFREFRRHFRTTGSIMPSSRFLARALVTEFRHHRASVRILEVGPGTGSVTVEIARHLHGSDRLDVVEINPTFVELMQRRLHDEEIFRRHRDQIEIIHAPVEQLPGKGVYDFIISGLPLNNFPVSQVREIFDTYTRLLKPGGILSYFEYALVRQLKTPFVNKRERRRLFRVGRVVSSYIRNFEIRREQILMNVPPATVRHLRFTRSELAGGPATPPAPRSSTLLSRS